MTTDDNSIVPPEIGLSGPGFVLVAREFCQGAPTIEPTFERVGLVLDAPLPVPGNHFPRNINYTFQAPPGSLEFGEGGLIRANALIAFNNEQQAGISVSAERVEFAGTEIETICTISSTSSALRHNQAPAATLTPPGTVLGSFGLLTSGPGVILGP